MFPAVYCKKLSSCLIQLKCLAAATERGTMSIVRSSSSQRSLQSPFSHMQMYGTQHPVLSKVQDSTKKKAKLKQNSKSTIRSASSISSVSSSRSTKSNSKMKLPTKTSSKSGVASHRNETSLSSTSFNIAQVDSSSPSPVRVKPQPYRTGSKSSPLSSTGKTKSRMLKTNGFPTTRDITSKFPGNSKSHSKSLQSSSDKPVSQSKSTTSCPTKTSLLTRTTSNKSTSEVLLKFQSQTSNNSLTHSVNVQLNKSSIFPRHVKAPQRTDSSRNGSSGEGRGGGTPVKRGMSLVIDDVTSGLERKQYQHVIVMSGAGISTASGIPDFRTPGTGLYDNLQQYKIPDPTAIFDIAFFSHNPNPFFTLARELYPGRYAPNAVHYFVKLLQEKGVLLRNYTQNIDGLERLAGMNPGKLVEAHGSFSTASCIKCKTKQDPAEVKATIFSGKTPRCTHKYCLGLVKPDIVFFGEDLPSRFHSLQLPDFSKCDLLIVMGTSLEVEPFASLAALPRYNVPRVLINRELVGPFKHHRKRRTDLAVIGDLVESVWKLASMAGWRGDLERLVQCEVPGRTLSSISERDERKAVGSSAAERELCSAMTELSVSERVGRKSSLTDGGSPSSSDSSESESSNEEGSTSGTSDSKSSEWSVSDVFSDLKDSK